MVIPVFDRAGNIVGKGENADYQHFLLFPQCFEMASFQGLLLVKSRDCVVEIYSLRFCKFEYGVLCGSVVECLTRNPGILGSTLKGVFRGSVFRQDTSEPLHIVLVNLGKT